ncbi:MAG: YbjN domain-containing protein [Bacteroidota bacterium]
MSAFQKVKDYLIQLEYNILEEDLPEELFIVEKEESGINRLIVDCEDPILIIEYPLFKPVTDKPEMYKQLLEKNRDIIHGAFAITDEGTVIFRDTLQLDNLDLNELEGSLESLELLLAEYAGQLIEFSK